MQCSRCTSHHLISPKSRNKLLKTKFWKMITLMKERLWRKLVIWSCQRLNWKKNCGLKLLTPKPRSPRRISCRRWFASCNAASSLTWLSLISPSTTICSRRWPRRATVNSLRNSWTTWTLRSWAAMMISPSSRTSLPRSNPSRNSSLTSSRSRLRALRSTKSHVLSAKTSKRETN